MSRQLGRDKPGWAPSTGRKLAVPFGEPQAKVPKRKSAKKCTPKSKVVPMRTAMALTMSLTNASRRD
ncbi:hypothetical protein T492DRAFT_891179 [Pavlovales sp. CCMP2436]|nr:hypothetical protein T492DRAFT_891179 [Pavlovales sp. CCMP2436]